MAIKDDYYRKEQAADELGVTTRTLDRWWSERVGPPRTKVGRQVLYRKSAIAQWLIDHESVAIRDQGRAA